MKDLNSYVIDDDSCLRISFNSSATDNLKIMQYARQKADCPYFRVMQAKKPYRVCRLEFIDDSRYRMVEIGVIK